MIKPSGMPRIVFMIAKVVYFSFSDRVSIASSVVVVFRRGVEFLFVFLNKPRIFFLNENKIPPPTAARATRACTSIPPKPGSRYILVTFLSFAYQAALP